MEARTGAGGILVYPDRGVIYGNEDLFEKGYRGSGADFEGRRTGGFPYALSEGVYRNPHLVSSVWYAIIGEKK